MVVIITNSLQYFYAIILSTTKTLSMLSWFNALQRDLTPPYVDDGLIEVVGFRDAWHGLVLLAPNGNGTRLAQVCGYTFAFVHFDTQATFFFLNQTFWNIF